MTLIARACCWAVRGAAKCAIPRSIDPAVTRLTLAAIRVYRRLLSRRTGRTCLFKPSCSQRAFEAIEAHGFARGIALAAAQIGRCGGSFTLSVTTTGETWLVTSDGLRFGPGDIADGVKTGARSS